MSSDGEEEEKDKEDVEDKEVRSVWNHEKEGHQKYCAWTEQLSAMYSYTGLAVIVLQLILLETGYLLTVVLTDTLLLTWITYASQYKKKTLL